MLVLKIRYYTKTVVQIFKTYTVTRIHRYIGIISGILTDSDRMNKVKYELHAFLESLRNDIRESYSKNIQKNFVLHSLVFSPNIAEYIAKKARTHGGFM